MTVVTITRGRPRLLERAMRSIRSQDYPVSAHLIVVDDCPTTITALEREPSPENVSVLAVSRGASDRNGPRRLARLRNLSLDHVKTRWISFLDDDNTFAADHISSLLHTAQTSGCSAVHSQRLMFHEDGRPYLDARFPWTRNPEAAGLLFEDGVRRGVFENGSNVLRDQVDLHHKAGGARIVDMNAWLFDASVLRSIRFREEYTYRDWLHLVAEDTKLLRDVVSSGVEIACTGRPTLNYFLGGYSNNFLSPDHPWLEDGECTAAEREREAMFVFPPSWRRAP